MKNIRFGTIGTSSITRKFVNAIKLVENTSITCVYSRSLVKAKQFCVENEINEAKCIDNLEEFVNHVDAIYIASPSGFHFPHAKFFIQKSIHVLVEKPISFTTKEVNELIKLAQEYNVVLLEAFRCVHNPNFNLLKQEISTSVVTLAQFNWSKFSSKIKDVSEQKMVPSFDKNIGKGSLYDALIYPVEIAISLFGKVKKVSCVSNKLESGVCIDNVAILCHENNTITSIVCSKWTTSIIPSEIIGPNVSFSFSSFTMFEKIWKWNRLTNTKPKLISQQLASNDMIYEILAFQRCILSKNHSQNKIFLQYSLETIRVLEEIEKITAKAQTVHYSTLQDII